MVYEERLLAKLTELAADGSTLCARVASWNTCGDAERHALPRAVARWRREAVTLLGQAGLEDAAAHVRQHASERHSATMESAVGEIEGAVSLLRGGFSRTLRYHVEAEGADSMVQDARQLEREGHVIPAAVLGRIVIERWLHQLAHERGIPADRLEKATSVNDRLWKADVYTQPKWRLIQAHLDTGNNAAHGRTEKFNDQDVDRLLGFAAELFT